MTTKAGVGYSGLVDSWQAGREAAAQAMKQAGTESCDLVLLFSSAHHDAIRLRDGVRSVVGPQPRLIGASSLGVITQENLGYDSPHTAVAVLRSDRVQADIFLEKGLVNREQEAGASLFNQIHSKDYEGDPKVLLLFDLVKEAGFGGVLRNSATTFLEGMSHRARSWPRFFGAGLIGDLKDRPAFQWFNDEIQRQSAVALVLSGGIRMDTLLLHGCRPSSDYHTVTKTDGNAILELDGKPALRALRDLVGPEIADEWMRTPFLIILGENRGDRYGPFREEDYAINFVMDFDPQRDALLMFGNELRAGSMIQLMHRKIDFMLFARKRDKKIAA